MRVVGYVPDLTPYFESLRLTVAPLRYGAGVKGKINQSLAHGVPVVTTAIGAEGIPGRDGEEFLVADAPADFARRVVELYTREDLWARLSANGLRCIARHYSPEAAKAALRPLFDGAAAHGQAGMKTASANPMRAVL